MKQQPAVVAVSDDIAWESARVDHFLQDLECAAPQPVSDFVPAWYRNLKGDLQQYRSDAWRYNHTARYCKGLQGLHQFGWTMPLPLDITREPNIISRKVVVPEMLYGTMWNDRDQLGNPLWDLTIIFWPWRARLRKGWRMLTTAYHLDWNPNWHSFTGLAPANYQVIEQKNAIGGNMYQWEQELDTDRYDYYNIETVHAFRPGTLIPKNSLIFSLMIIPAEQGSI